jgi:hypothetical protein
MTAYNKGRRERDFDEGQEERSEPPMKLNALAGYHAKTMGCLSGRTPTILASDISAPLSTSLRNIAVRKHHISR